MCGRMVREDADYQLIFGFLDAFDLPLEPRYNIAPTQQDVLVRDEPDGRHLRSSFWGLIPVWAKERRVGARMFNARAETLLERPAFRSLVGTRRCIIPISGFYEWQATPQGKQPLYIHRSDRTPLALAGLWTAWHNREPEEVVTSHTVITCAANDFMRPVHERMPAILEGDAIDQWLDLSSTDPGAVLGLLRPFRDDGLSAYPVSALVNNARHQGAELIAPLPV